MRWCRRTEFASRKGLKLGICARSTSPSFIRQWRLLNEMYNVDLYKSGFDKTNKKAEERKRKARPIFQHKQHKDYENSQLGQL